MRILDISPRLVWPPGNGSTARMYHLLRELSRRHEVRQFSQPRWIEVRRADFAPEARPTDTYREHRNRNLMCAAGSEFCNRSWIRPQAVLSGACLRLTRPKLLRDWFRWADIALVEFPWQFAYCRRVAPQLPMVLASHNIEVLTRTSNARAIGLAVKRSPMLRFVARLERHAVARADLILAVSEDDREEYVQRYGADGDRIVVVPNGSDTTELFPVEASAKATLRAELGLPDRSTVVYLAGGTKIPDLEGLKWVRRLADRRPELSFVIVGGISPRSYTEGNVIATGFVPDHRPYLQAADISLNPIEYGGGTKLKVFDGLAAGLATVVFAEAIRGTQLQPDEHLLVAEKNDDALERTVCRLVAEPSFATALGAAGRRFVSEHHDWRTIARGLESVLVEFLRDPRAGR
jgi:glycosyltransferase involved in cell wall biosynthesis